MFVCFKSRPQFPSFQRIHFTPEFTEIIQPVFSQIGPA